MSSPAALKYITATDRIQTLRKAATDKRLRPMSQDEIQVYYHASLAAYVAAWDAYINDLVREFYDVIADSSNSRFNAIYTIAQQAAGKSIRGDLIRQNGKIHAGFLFNTPDTTLSITGSGLDAE